MNEQPIVPKKEQPNLIAIFSYFGLLFLIPLLTNKNDDFVQFHAKQGLVLFAFEALTAIFAGVPIFGWVGAPLLYIFWFILSIVGIINVVKEKQEKLPVIGYLADRFKI
jgi:uncharacterized membrane protein